MRSDRKRMMNETPVRGEEPETLFLGMDQQKFVERLLLVIERRDPGSMGRSLTTSLRSSASRVQRRRIRARRAPAAIWRLSGL